MRTRVVVNPAAGHGRGWRVWQKIRPRLLERMPELDCVRTERPGHARELAREAAAARLERVIAVGGDGTVSEVAGGLALSDTRLGIVPAGTGNDFSRELGLSAEPLAAAWVALTAQQVQMVDLGEVRTRDQCATFVNVAGLGFDAAVAGCVSAASWLGPLGGSLPYVVGVLRTLRGFRPRPIRLTVDGQPLERTALLVAVALGRRYGGGMLIAPQAILDDGLFDVCLIGEVSPIEVLRLLPRMSRGAHRGHPQVEFFRCRELRAESLDQSAVGCHADGELVGELPATFRVRTDQLRCVAGRAT